MGWQHPAVEVFKWVSVMISTNSSFTEKKPKLIFQKVRFICLFIYILSRASRLFAKKKWKLPEIKTSLKTKSYQICPAMCWSDEKWTYRTMSVVWEKELIWDILYIYRIGWTKSLSYIYMSKLAFIPFIWLLLFIWQLLQCLIGEYFLMNTLLLN